MLRLPLETNCGEAALSWRAAAARRARSCARSAALSLQQWKPKIMEFDNKTSTRRQVVGGIATGAFAAMATPAFAQQPGGGQTPQPAQSKSLQNPQTDFPKPPFPKQQQQWPGLASEMNPPPDHGENSYVGSGRLTGRRALITGGDSGIGRAAAIAFAREGADVAINYLPQEEPDARQVADLIRAAGRKAVTIPGDIKSEQFCQKLVADTVQQLGGLDILVNNAARQMSQDSIEKISSEQFDEVFKTNVYATFWITKAAISHLQPGATIINTASVVAYDPPKNIVDYAMTKAAIEIFSKGLAKQLAERGIRVNAVAPGPVWTPLQVTGGQPPEKLPQFGADTPMGRPGQPVEMAGLYVLLASPESSYSTAQVFAAAGGAGGP
jgi:NAD(P)-dependent dehydrogenase (short-subunit alcohol dehydrogenase family)